MSITSYAKLNSVNPAHIQLLQSKFKGIPSKRIVCVADYDLTLADKLNKKNPDDSPMTPEHYLIFRDFCGRIGQPVLLTARGEGLHTGLFSYMRKLEKDHGRIPNLEIASNSGHFRHFTWMPRSQGIYPIPIPGLNEAEWSQIVSEIHQTLIDKMESAFPEITAADKREMCGAVIAQFRVDQDYEKKYPGLTSERFQDYLKHMQDLKREIPEGLGESIEFVSKYWAEDDQGNKNPANPADRYVTKGYTDMLLLGMSKGVTSKVIFDDYAKKIRDPFLMVLGDSVADFDMMIALKNAVPKMRRLFVSVGNGLVEHDEAHAAKHGGEKLLDLVLTQNKTADGKADGPSPVEQMHMCLDIIGRDTSFDPHYAGRGLIRFLHRLVSFAHG